MQHDENYARLKLVLLSLVSSKSHPSDKTCFFPFLRKGPTKKKKIRKILRREDRAYIFYVDIKRG